MRTVVKQRTRQLKKIVREKRFVRVLSELNSKVYTQEIERETQVCKKSIKNVKISQLNNREELNKYKDKKNLKGTVEKNKSKR